jgi:hypothetical protein
MAFRRLLLFLLSSESEKDATDTRLRSTTLDRSPGMHQIVEEQTSPPLTESDRAFLADLKIDPN